MFFDPMYCLFILPGLGLSLWASARVKCTAPGFLDTRLRYAAGRSSYASRASIGV